jgi:hypothetical protein
MIPYEAYLAKGLLESEGIHASVIDENTSGTILYSPAIGGVKIQVSEADYERARKILGYGQQKACTIPKKETRTVCPECGSFSVSTNHFSFKTVMAFLVSFFMQIPVLSRRTQKVCKECGRRWQGKY